jgi:hypothetical protein
LNVRQLSERKGQNWMRAATHCVHGHEFTEANTYWNDWGWRVCRACRNEAQKRRYAGRKGERS